MQKRDFIQQALIQFLPELAWDFDKAFKYAEKAWFKLSEKGYGDPSKQAPREIPKAYDQLKKNPVMKAAFDLFWTAFNLKKGIDGAATRWLQLGELSKPEYDQIILAAKREAEDRKKLPEGAIPKHAQGWLTERRWMDSLETSTETAQKKQNQHEYQLRQLNQDLSHAKRMADDTGDPYWYNEADKLTDQLRQLRDAND